MAVDQDALADVVVMTVKSSLASAMAPVLERLAVAEARLAAVPNVEKVIGDIRDRVLTVETKALVQPVVVASAEPVDLAPVLADVKSLQTQIAGWESRWNDLGTLRERVAVVEAKELPSVPDPVAPVDLNPLFQRLAVAEHKLAALPATEQALGAMRDRMVAVETKAATEPRPEPPVRFDDALLPVTVLERLASAEALLKAQGDLRDRVLVVETKAAAPLQPDVAIGLLEKRLTAMETTQAIPTAAEIMLSDVKSRLTALEGRKEAAPVSDDGTDLRDRVVALETRADAAVVELRKEIASVRETEEKDAIRLEGYTSFLQRDKAALSERLAVVETRPLIPGPPGEPGPPGTNGVDGKDGLAGLSFEGVYQEGQSYEKGQLATWGGSSWHCNATTTTKPGDGSKDWTLMVKRGRDGRDGQSAPGALPVVAVGSRS